MYFEVEPKSRKEDFFNYDYEHAQLRKALQANEKITAVVGVRRVGKTSLLNVAYNETRHLKLWLDGRIVTDPKKEVFATVYETARTGKPSIFGEIQSLNVSAFGVGLSVKIGSETRGEMEKKIKSAGRISVFIDEAQRMKTKDLADVLSYFYDRLPQVSFVISGSEVGLVEEILGESDAEHPLYGREILKIVLNRLDKNKANEYLKKGFEQLGLKPSEEELDAAVDELDGLIGWLTLYGYEKGVKKSADALEKTSRNAARIAASELVRFLKKVKNKKLYSSILKNASGVGWDELRVRASKETGRQLNPNSFNLALERLTTYSFIEKKDGKYGLSDPLLLKALFLL